MTDFLQLVIAGVGVGSLYALVALGFVIIYKATGVINFAQGALVSLGAYMTFGFHQELRLPFYLSVPLAMAAGAVTGLLVERIVLRRMVGQPVFAVIMITIGLAIVIDQLITWKWGASRLEVGDPWGLSVIRIPLGASTLVLVVVDLVRIISAGTLLVAFFVFFRYSRVGVAMRATASDQEAAMAQGISAGRIFGLSWAIAAATAAVAGVLLAAGARGIDPTLSFVALLAFPAIILGGLDSPPGAIVGGVVIGLVEVMTAAYGPRYLPEFVGANFHSVTPYVVLVAVLLIRPYGLFGTREVSRV